MTFASALSLLAATAWAAAPDAKIVNGEDELEHPAVISLGAEFGSQRFSLCTGSIITTRLILTAAHCGEDVPPEIVASAGRAYGGADIYEPDFELRLANMQLHPEYRALGTNGPSDVSQFDIAVVELAEDAPVLPIPIHLDAVSDADLAREMLSVGFGASSGDGRGSGTKRSAVLLLEDYDDQFLYTLARSNPTGGNICSGDSGGPQMLQRDDGTWEQWAVHSWGVQGCQGLSASQRTDAAADWLMERIIEVHGTDDLCDARGLYGDGVCDATCDADPDCAAPLAAADGEVAGGACASVGSTAPLGALALAGLLSLGARRRPRLG